MTVAAVEIKVQDKKAFLNTSLPRCLWPLPGSVEKRLVFLSPVEVM